MALLRKIREKIKSVHLIRIAVVFYKSVWAGYRLYQRLKMKYGAETEFISCAPKGTGDYYVLGLFFQAWKEKNRPEYYKIIVGGGAEKRALELFPDIIPEEDMVMVEWEEYKLLTHFRITVGNNCDITYFHHIAMFGTGYTEHLWITWLLMGYKGLNQTDFYLNYGFELPAKAEKTKPTFCNAEKHIEDFFDRYKLVPGKTVLISPYSTGNGELIKGFWNSIVEELLENGFSVCTNCFGEEKPLKGTTALSLTYADSVPFLNRAGYFLGIRSGLCDIISSSTCQKYIVHTYYANHWPNGNSMAYTSLNGMGLCKDAIEYTLTPDNGNAYQIKNSILVKMGVRKKSRKKLKSIAIKYVDVPPDFDVERHWITRVLREKYDVHFSDEPQFLFYSVFGVEALNYHNCVKIFFTGEDTIPNFNDCDYAMCHDRISFGDRYIRADVGERYGEPIGKLSPDWIEKGIDSDQWMNSSLIDVGRGLQDRSIVSRKMLDRRFCNFVYSNDIFGEGAILRKQFCLELMKYRHVDCPGRILTNMPGGIPLRWGKKDGQDSIAENWAVSKLEFIKNYKFTIAFENTSMAGHTTEKLIHPLYAYSVPIYWGNPEVAEDFNPKAFINCNDYGNDMRRVIKKVIELDQDDEQYLEMLRQPPMRENFDFDQEKKAKQFLYHIIEKGNKPFVKNSLEFSATNQMRKSFYELQPVKQELNYIKGTNSWKIMTRLQRFADSPWGYIPKRIFRKLLDLYRNAKKFK